MRLEIYLKPLLSLLASFIILFPALSWAGPNDKQMLIINSYNEAGPWSKEMVRPVTMMMAKTAGISSTIVHLNGTLVKDSLAYEQMTDGLFSRFDDAPEYIVMVGNLAGSLMPRIKQEWGDVPMLLITKKEFIGPMDYYFTGAEDHSHPAQMIPLERLRDEYNFTSIYVPDLYHETIDLMVQVLPNMKELVFLADEIYINRDLNRAISQYLHERYPHLRYTWLRGNQENSRKMRDYLVEESDTTGLLLSTWFYEREGVHGYPMLVAGDFNMIPSSTRPVFSLRNSYMEYGVIGGVYPDPEAIKNRIREVVELMTGGVSPRIIPFFDNAEPVKMLDFSQVEESGIDSSLIPDDVVMKDEPPGLWERYRMRLLGALALILAGVFGFVWYYWYQKRKIGLLQSYHRLVDHMPIAYSEATIIFDNNGNVFDLEYRTCNVAFQHMLDSNHVEGCTYKLFPPEYISMYTEALLLNRKAVSFTHYFTESDTYYEFIMCLIEKNEGHPSDDIDIFAIDITQRSKAQKDLQQTAQKLDLTLNAARIIPWQWDLTHHVIYCEAHRVFRYLNMPSRLINEQEGFRIEEEEYLSHVHPDDVKRMIDARNRFARGEEKHYRMEFRVVNKRKGKEVIEWFEVNAAPSVFNPNSHLPECLVGSLLIITERKRQEHALMEARDKASESDRLKSAFLANMSHEIRTPLNAIVGFSQLLISTTDEDKKKQFSGIINDNNELLLQLINDVLDLAKIESNTLEFNFRPTDINQLIDTVGETIKMRIKPGVAFNRVKGASECVVRTDGNRVSQVIINFLTNACKFTERGSITLSYDVDDDDITFEVRDTGIGMRPENREKLFKRFSKLNHFAQGNGLGLSISKTIVEKLGGQIGVESRGPGLGSTFWFTIPNDAVEPAQQPEEVQEAAPTEQKPIVVNKNIKILVADDNESNFMLFNAILSPHFMIKHAHDGVEAVEMARSMNPNIILMDLNMPNMDGYEAAREIHKFLPNTPIIAVTAYALAGDKDRVMATKDFESYMSKPIDSNKLMDMIHGLIDKKFFLM